MCARIAILVAYLASMILLQDVPLASKESFITKICALVDVQTEHIQMMSNQFVSPVINHVLVVKEIYTTNAQDAN